MYSFVATFLKFCLLFLAFASFLPFCTATEPTVPWYENLPAVAMDYKVHIDPGKEDCYFQYVNPGATFYVSLQVIYVFYSKCLDAQYYGIVSLNQLFDGIHFECLYYAVRREYLLFENVLKCIRVKFLV